MGEQGRNNLYHLCYLYEQVSAAFVGFLAESCTSLNDLTVQDGMIVSSELIPDEGSVSCDSKNKVLLST